MAATYEAGLQRMLDSGGRQFSVDTKFLASFTESWAVVSTDLNPGIVLKLVLPFDIPEGTKPVAMAFHASASSPGVTIALPPTG
jgi:hypothetical protein